MPSHDGHPQPSSAPAFQPSGYDTANDRFKQGAAWRTSRGLIAAAAIHFALFALWPQMSAATLTSETADMTIIQPPDVEIPPAPEQIARPAAPVVGDVTLTDEFTIPTNEELWVQQPEIAPPPVAAQREDEGYTVFVPSMVAPRLLNADEVQRALRANYPVLLRNSGIGGTVEMHLWLDERGTITKAEVGRSSGQPQLDEAALRVVRVMRMSPALNRGAAVRVIVSLPLKFSVE